MKSFIKKLSLSLTALCCLLAFSPAVLVSAQSKADVCEGIGLTGGGGNTCANPTGSPDVDSTIKTVINLLSLVVGVIAVIMIIVGGLKYIMSSGDSNAINSAKNTILFALVGLAIVALAQIIVRFVVNRVTAP